MGSPLGPILAGIFVVELETTTFPTPGILLLKWKRHVDYTYCIVKTGSANKILLKPDSFHMNIHMKLKAIICYHFWMFW